MTKTLLRWEQGKTPVELRPLLAELSTFYPIVEGGNAGLPLAFEPVCTIQGCEVRIIDGTAAIRYSTLSHATRAVGALLSGLVSARQPYLETTPFETLGIMLDCSRNAVMKVEHVQRWLRQLSLLGYNMVMLYTEDTYQLPGEPYFGYKRGAYSASELKAMDRYAATLGIEIVPCIQTLGHMERILGYPAYLSLRDTSCVMMVGEPATYALIEKMVAHWSNVFRTKRIHVGMDETHDLGRGRYLDKYGYRNGFELFNEHLAKVVAICQAHDRKPMIWSDMYFRLGNENQDYYDPKTVIPDAVVQQIPPGVELVYWDYYHDEQAFYMDWIDRHRQLGKEPLVGSGIWTWNKYWYDHNITKANAGACIDACYARGLKELFFTMWGDNGAYCDHDSAFAGIVFCADKAFGTAEPDAVTLEKRFRAVCGGSYAAHILASDLHGGTGMPSPNMWDDPIFETQFRTWAQDHTTRMRDTANGFAALARRLRRHAQSCETGHLQYAHATAAAFAARYSLATDLLSAYRRKDRRGIQSVRRRITKVVAAVQAMETAFRTMWMSHNKPEGIETIQGRFGMVVSRYRELDRRLVEYLSGAVSCIPELDCKCPPDPL